MTKHFKITKKQVTCCGWDVDASEDGATIVPCDCDICLEKQAQLDPNTSSVIRATVSKEDVNDSIDSFIIDMDNAERFINAKDN
jgi:hypothetical protein